MKILAYHLRMRRHFIPTNIHQEKASRRRVNKKLLGFFRTLVSAIHTCRQQKHSFLLMLSSIFHCSTPQCKKNEIGTHRKFRAQKKVFWWLKFRWGNEKWMEMKRKFATLILYVLEGNVCMGILKFAIQIN